MSSSTVIVTGAAGGLGKAIATAYLAAGANVAICDINQERLLSTEQEWSSAGYKAERFLTTTTDVTDSASVQRFIDATIAKFGRLDVLVNNAGIMDDLAPVGECSPEMWNKVLGVNLHGPFNTSRTAIAQFQKQEQPGGVIINVCSVAGGAGHLGGAAYTASKHGLAGLSKNTAFEYADKGIYSITLFLGLMNTNISEPITKCAEGEALQKFHQRTQVTLAGMDPATNLVPLENVAKYCVFVSLDKSIARNLNGSTATLSNNWPPS